MPDLLTIDELNEKTEDMEDEALVGVMLAALDCLLYEHGLENGTTNVVQVARSAFGEIAVRWIPQSVGDAAFAAHVEEDREASVDV